VNLLVRAPNWLGDIVMALPAIQTIREHFATAVLTVAAPQGFTPLCAAIPGVDDVLPLPRGSTWRTWRAQRDAIRERGIDLAILLTNSWGSAFVLTQAGVPERWGYRTDMRGRWLTRGIERPSAGRRGGLRPPRVGTLLQRLGVPELPAGRSGDRVLRAGADALAPPNVRHRVHAVMTTPHHSHYYLALTDALGMAPIASFPPIPVPVAARERAEQLLRDRGAGTANRRLVAVAPGAAYGHAKRWPPAAMA